MIELPSQKEDLPLIIAVHALLFPRKESLHKAHPVKVFMKPNLKSTSLTRNKNLSKRRSFKNFRRMISSATCVVQIHHPRRPPSSLNLKTTSQAASMRPTPYFQPTMINN